MSVTRDAVVIGAGPAGIAAAIYLRRTSADVMLIESKKVGGLLRNANLVENYPGFPDGLSGEEMTALFVTQLRKRRVKVTKGAVKSIGFSEGLFTINCDFGKIKSKTVVICTGTKPRNIRLPGTTGLTGKRIFSEITDFDFQDDKPKRILIVGGGDASFDYSVNLLMRGHDVHVFSRSEPECLGLLMERARNNGVHLHRFARPIQVVGTNRGVKLTYVDPKGRKNAEGDYLLIACGREPNLPRFRGDLAKKVARTSELPKTAVPGLFIAGDAARGIHRQTGIAVGDGILAAMMVIEHLKEREVDQ